MKALQPSSSEHSESLLSQASSAISDVYMFFKEISQTSGAICRSIHKYPLYCRKMRENESSWRLKCEEQIFPDERQIRELQRFAKFYNILYGDPSSQSFREKAFNYLQLNFVDQQKLYAYIIQKFAYFGVNSFMYSNFAYTALYYPVFVVFELDHTVYVVVRGTYSLRDIFADGFGLPIEINGERVHGGFARSVYFILSKIGDSLVGRDVVVIGHSYGAAIGAILTHVIKDQVASVKAYIFGCPPCYSPTMLDSCHDDIVTIVYGQDPVPHMGVYGLSMFDFRLESSAIAHFYSHEQIHEALVKGGIDQRQMMCVPGRILYMVPVLVENGKIQSVQWYRVQYASYLELVMYGFAKMMRDHTMYLQALASCLSELDETPFSVDSDLKSEDDLSFFQRLFKK